MIRYIAFLRGINVSGQKIIKMETLRNAMTIAGFADVKTYIQSGNVLFNSNITNPDYLISSIENLIEKTFGFRTDVIIRNISEIEAVSNSLQINYLQPEGKKKYYITFLKNDFPETLELPIFSKNHDVEIIYQDKKDFISISSEYKGIYGFPNSVIEKLTGIPATTRNPDTLAKILNL